MLHRIKSMSNLREVSHLNSQVV